MNKIIIPNQDYIHLVEAQEIVYCQSDNYYTHIHLNAGIKHLLVKTLSKFEKELNDTRFIRVNQSFLVNKAYIKTINKKKKSLSLTNDQAIPFTLSLKKLMELLVH